jgi:hypothetical protein
MSQKSGLRSSLVYVFKDHRRGLVHPVPIRNSCELRFTGGVSLVNSSRVCVEVDLASREQCGIETFVELVAIG